MSYARRLLKRRDQAQLEFLLCLSCVQLEDSGSLSVAAVVGDSRCLSGFVLAGLAGLSGNRLLVILRLLGSHSPARLWQLPRS